MIRRAQQRFHATKCYSSKKRDTLYIMFMSCRYGRITKNNCFKFTYWHIVFSLDLYFGDFTVAVNMAFIFQILLWYQPTCVLSHYWFYNIPIFELNITKLQQLYSAGDVWNVSGFVCDIIINYFRTTIFSHTSSSMVFPTICYRVYSISIYVISLKTCPRNKQLCVNYNN